MGPGIAIPLGHGHHDDTAVAVDGHRPSCGGNSSTPRGVCNTSAQDTRVRGPSTTRSARRLGWIRPYEPTSMSTMGTWPSSHHTARPRTPAGAGHQGLAGHLVPRPTGFGNPPRHRSRGGCMDHAGWHGDGGGHHERGRGLIDPRGLRGGHLPRGRGHDTPILHPQASAAAGGVLAHTTFRVSGWGPPDVSRRRPLWGWNTPRVHHGPGRPTSLPTLGHKRGYYAV